jgi:membrane protein
MNPRQLLAEIERFPWLATVQTLRERFREDRLGLSASSLTFTTTIALVPFFTVALALFTAFPMFGKLQANLQGWLVQSLVPESISRQVLGYLTQFAGKASRLGVAGLAALLVSALALVFTIDRTLNGIWRVRRRRALPQRVLIYWAAMTLGPLLLGISVSSTSYVISASRGFVGGLPGVVTFFLDTIEFLLLGAALSSLYHYVPNTPVRRRDAMAGGFGAALVLEIAKRVLTWYIANMGTYSAVYGAFATLPILLVWIYIAWLIVLFGAVLAAYLPSLLTGAHRRSTAHGWQFQLALEALQQLKQAQVGVRRGLSAAELAQAMQVDSLQLEPVLHTLVQLDWIGRLNEVDDESATRYILLADVQSTALEPLLRHLLLPFSEATAKLWHTGRLSTIYLKDVI